MGRPRRHENARLTKKQQTFAELVVTKEGELTLRECAQQAGYSVTSSHTRAYELLNPRISPHVVAEVRRRREELNEKFAVDYGRHVRSLAKLRDESLANGAYAAAVNAERLRGQAAGLYVSKSEVRIGSIDQMSKADVEKAWAARYWTPKTPRLWRLWRMTVSPEAQLWSQLRTNKPIERRFELTRVENSAVPGTPDVMVCDDNGDIHLIELKILKK